MTTTTTKVGRSGEPCLQCGHRHSSADLGGICVGCPCLAGPDGLAFEDAAPSQVLVDATTAVSRSIAQVLALAGPLLRPSEAGILRAAQRIARDLPFDDR